MKRANPLSFGGQFLEESTNLLLKTVHNCLQNFHRSTLFRIQWFLNLLVKPSPLSSEGKFSGRVNQSVKYVYSCLELVNLIKTVLATSTV